MNEARLTVAIGKLYQQDTQLHRTRATSGADIVAKYMKHTGRKVNIRILPVKEAIGWHIQRGSVPPEQVSFLENRASWHTAISLWGEGVP